MTDRGLELCLGVVIVRREANGRCRALGGEVDQTVPAEARRRVDAAPAQRGDDLSRVAAAHLGGHDRALLPPAIENTNAVDGRQIATQRGREPGRAPTAALDANVACITSGGAQAEHECLRELPVLEALRAVHELVAI